MNTLTRIGIAFVVAAFLMATTLRQLVSIVQDLPFFAYTSAISILGPNLDITKLMEVVVFSAVILFYVGVGVLITEAANFVATGIFEGVAGLSNLLGKALTRGFTALKRSLGYTIVS
jgi:hypothetical protein